MSANDFITGRSLALPTCQNFLLLTELSPANHVEDLAGLIMVTSHVTRITLVTHYLIGWFNLRMSWTSWKQLLHATFQNNRTGERKMIMNISDCGEVFHTDSWLAEVNPGHRDPDAILQALLPGPSTVVLFGPGKARMGSKCSRVYALSASSSLSKPSIYRWQWYSLHRHSASAKPKVQWSCKNTSIWH